MPAVIEVTKIDAALGALLNACGMQSESDTERLFWVHGATEKVREQWGKVEQSHREGLCFNVNALLSDAIADELLGGGKNGKAA